MTRFIDIQNQNGKPFRVHVALPGEPRINTSDPVEGDDPMVTIVDRQYNQFIASYYASTLIRDFDDGIQDRGLQMQGGIPEWTLDTPAFNKAILFIKSEMERA